MPETQNNSFHVQMDADKLQIKPELLSAMYSEIDSTARKLAGSSCQPQELRISRDARDPTKYNVAATSRMTGFLIASLQETINRTSSMQLRLHFQKLQELLMAEMFAGAKDIIQIG